MEVSNCIILPSRMSTDHLNGADTDNHLKELFHILPFVAGKSDVAENIDMEPSTWVQFASISKTVGTAYAMQVFQNRAEAKVRLAARFVGNMFWWPPLWSVKPFAAS